MAMEEAFSRKGAKRRGKAAKGVNAPLRALVFLCAFA
jgi:hypothetical protein